MNSLSSATQSSEDSSQVCSRWCAVCGVACNSDVVFQTHLRGRRHLRNEMKMDEAGQFLVQQRSLYRTLTPYQSDPTDLGNGRSRLHSQGTRSVLEYQMPNVNGTAYVNKGYSILRDIALAAKIPISMETSQCPFDELSEGCEQSENGRETLWRLSNAGTQCFKTELRVGHDMFVARGVSTRDTCRRVVTSALNVLLSDFDAVNGSDSSPAENSESSATASRNDSLATNGTGGARKTTVFPAAGYISATVLLNFIKCMVLRIPLSVANHYVLATYRLHHAKRYLWLRPEARAIILLVAIAQLDYLRTKPVEAQLDIQKQMMKQLNAPVALRHGLHSLADLTARKLREFSGSLAEKCQQHSCHIFSNELPTCFCCSYHSTFSVCSRPHEGMPSKLNAISLLPADPVLYKYARLLYAIRVGAYASNVINIHDRTIRMIVICDSFYRTANGCALTLPSVKCEPGVCYSPFVADPFFDGIVNAILSPDVEGPTASERGHSLDVRKFEEDGKVVVKQNVLLNDEWYELACEVSFLGMQGANDVLVEEIQQQLWMNTYFQPIQRSAVSALRILRSMSLNPTFQVDFVSLYDWAKLVNQTVIYLENKTTLVVGRESRRAIWDSMMCPVSICCELFRRLAGGALLSPQDHLSAPSSAPTVRRLCRRTAPWPNESYAAIHTDHWCEHLSENDRLRLTTAAQFIVNEVISGEFPRGNLDILDVLLPSC